VRNDRLRVLDALEQISLVRSFAERGREAFYSDILIQSAILHRLALLGEACRALSPQLRSAHPELPWAQIVAFRNVLIHEYFGIDLDLVWEIVVSGIGPIKTALTSILVTLAE
jgi:uncharacterized protein with HEPN domain